MRINASVFATKILSNLSLKEINHLTISREKFNNLGSFHFSLNPDSKNLIQIGNTERPSLRNNYFPIPEHSRKRWGGGEGAELNFLVGRMWPISPRQANNNSDKGSRSAVSFSTPFVETYISD